MMARKERGAKKGDSLHMLIVESRYYDKVSDELLVLDLGHVFDLAARLFQFAGTF